MQPSGGMLLNHITVTAAGPLAATRLRRHVELPLLSVGFEGHGVSSRGFWSVSPLLRPDYPAESTQKRTGRRRRQRFRSRQPQSRQGNRNPPRMAIHTNTTPLNIKHLNAKYLRPVPWYRLPDARVRFPGTVGSRTVHLAVRSVTHLPAHLAECSLNCVPSLEWCKPLRILRVQPGGWHARVAE